MRSRSRSRSSSLSSGIESAYEPDPGGSPDRSPSPSPSPAPSGKSHATAPATSPTRPSRAEYSRYAHLVSSLAARDAADLSARLAGSGVWSSQFWGAASAASASARASSPVAPRWAVAASSPRQHTEGEGESEIDPDEEVQDEVEVDELDSDPDMEDIPHRLRASTHGSHRTFTAGAHTPRQAGSTRLAASLAAADLATRWPLHPSELGPAPGMLPALRDSAARMLRRDHLGFPAFDTKASWRRAQRHAHAELRAARRRAELSPADDGPPLAAASEMDIDLDADDGVGFVPDPDGENYLPPALAERVAAALDRTLAALVAFRPKMTAAQRTEGGLGWESVLAAAAMGVDRSVVENTERRLREIFPATDGSAPGQSPAPAPAPPPASAATSASQLAQRLDMADEIGGFPRRPATDLAAELYTLPPLRMTRRVKDSVYKRSQKDAEERAATAKRHAARIAAAALKRAEHAARVAANRETRARRLASTESYAHRARERARAWREKKRLETPAEGAET